MFLTEADRSAIQRRLGQMQDDVNLTIFVGDDALSKELEDFARMVTSAATRIRLEVENSEGGKNQLMKGLHVERWPSLVLIKGDFSRIHYLGVPLGYEIPALIDAFVELSNSSTPLSPRAKETLLTVRRKANVKVFVLPTCPFCPTVARHAYRGAIESPRVTAEIIDSGMFPDIATHHAVMGVPKIVLNNNLDITGAVTDVEFFDKLRDSDHALLDSMYS